MDTRNINITKLTYLPKFLGRIFKHQLLIKAKARNIVRQLALRKNFNTII